MYIDERLLAYKPISVTLNFDWDKMSYDERVLARHNYIEEQKKKDPNYVGFDFIEHFSSTHGGLGKCKNKKSKHTVDFARLINTIGQVIRIRCNEVTITFGTEASGYRVINRRKNNTLTELKIHRAVGCTFIPIPERLSEFRETIVINHKNDIKSCNLKSNLEWVTQKENSIKAVETGAIVSTAFKFTITRPGDYFGKEYYFSSKSSLEKCGFDYASVHNYLNKGRLYLCGNWEVISKEELKDKVIGISKVIIDYIRDPKYGVVSAKGNVGTIISEGPCKGERFVIYGDNQLKLFGFKPCAVTTCITGGRPNHRNCTWVKMTREECAGIPIGLTEEQRKHIFR